MTTSPPCKLCKARGASSPDGYCERCEALVFYVTATPDLARRALEEVDRQKNLSALW